jgi:predicted nucleic acid-binding Zn ribbon protein
MRPVTHAVSKLCSVCGKVFQPRRKDAATCSNKCRQALFRQKGGRSIHVLRPISIIPDDGDVPLSPKIEVHRSCYQCGAGTFTDPPSDEPTVTAFHSGRRIWLRPECAAYRDRYWHRIKIGVMVGP